MSATSSFDLSPNIVRPEDVDIEIYNQRLLYVLDKTIQRIKLVDILNTLLSEETSSFWSAISADFKDKIYEARDRYQNDQELTSELFGEDAKALEADAKTIIIDNELAKILVYLQNNAELQALMSNEIEIQKSPHSKTFVKCLEVLRDSVEIHQGENAAQERAKERHLKRCYQRIEKAKKEIFELENELTAKKTEMNTNIVGKNLVINRHQSKIDKIQRVSREEIEKRIESAESAINTDYEASQGVQEVLNSELDLAQEKYDAILKEHLEIEKELRNQRTKVENQLSAFMQKFDKDMKEKHTEEEELQSKYDEERKKYDAVQKQLDEQGEEYDELMQEKAAYEQELLEQKLFIFILNRSARRIQRCFRAYKLKKMTKKKGKGKGKKGKGK